MLSSSVEFNELMKSRIRPKLEPTVTVHGKDANGQEVLLVWNSHNIVKLSFERGIDPQGNEFPYMELKWTEVYNGKLNEDTYPEKYKNITALMACDLEWTQSLTLSSRDETWKSVYDVYTWQSLYQSGATWNLVQKKETVKAPRLFLTGTPEVKNNTITWKAVDLLFFLDVEWMKFFGGKKYSTSIKNILISGLIEARAFFWDNENIRDLIQKSAETIKNNPFWFSYPWIDENVLCNGILKKQLVLACAIADLYLDFDESGAIVAKEFDFREKSKFLFDGNVMFENPKVTFNPPMKTYNWVQYWHSTDGFAPYSMNYQSLSKPSGITIADGAKDFSFARYNFVGYGQTYQIETDASDPVDYVSEATYDILAVDDDVEVVPYIFVNRINSNKYSFSLENSNVEHGEVVKEDNPLNPKDDSEYVRFEFLKKLFKENETELEFRSLGNVALTTSDRVQVETNLFDEDNNRIVKNGIVKELKIEYNGAVKERMLVKELSVWQN